MNSAARELASPRPFLPSDLPAEKIFIRACAAHAVAAARGPGSFASQVCRQLWPKDVATLALVERSTSAPAMTTVTGWAAELSHTATARFIGSLLDSAAAKLIAAAPRFELTGIAALHMPRASSTGQPQWVGEGAPIPVAQAMITGLPTLGPVRKLGLIEVLTREISEASPENVESIVGLIMTDALTKQLDMAMFSTTAASAIEPAGLLAGVTPTTASSSVDGFTAALADTRSLVDAVAAGGGSGVRSMFFASPGRALGMLAYIPALAGRVYGSASIPGTELICVDPNGFASAFTDEPEIRASKETVLHFDDANPLAIGTPGTPPTVAAPSLAMFQSDLIAIRGILRAVWCMRVPCVAYIATGMTW